VSVPAGGFPALEVLNLSYNGLSSAAVAALADMPRLRQLDLSSNQLTAMPADMSGFASLHSLNLEHNKLSSSATWLALGTLPMLRSLSLAHNRVDGLSPAAADTSFPQLTTLDLSTNQIAKEEALLPVLQMGSLRTLLLYNNPFLHRGAASDDFHQVLSRQRAIDLVTLPPPPPAPPAKIDLSVLTTVSEPPTRKKLVTVPPVPKPKKPPSKTTLPPVAKPAADDGADSSFFLTAGGGDQQPNAMLAAQAAALDEDVWGPADDMFDGAIDIRTAVTALKAAVERPPVAPTNAAAPHLRMTESLARRRRPKFEPPDDLGGRAPTSRMADGMAAPVTAGGAVEDMAMGIGDLQRRMGSRLATHPHVDKGATLDPEGDACVSSLQSMLSAMQEMSVGAGGGGALPHQA